MNYRRLSIVTLPALALLASAGGCAPASKDTVKILGYINVTSHCQVPLLDTLHKLDKKHGKDLTLEIVDFGSEAGKRRWLGDGYRCLTILIDGKNEVMIERDGVAKRTSFRMPPGIMWLMEDLTQAVEERVAALPKNRSKAPVTARKTNAGHEVGEVQVGAKTVFRYHAASGGMGAYDRAKLSAERLKKLYLDKLTPSEVQTGKRKGLWVVFARGENLATATAPEARASKTTPEKLVGVWAKNLKAALK